MTWHELAPGTHQARGNACTLTVTRDRDRPDLWTVQMDWGLRSPLLSAAERFSGTLEAAQVHALACMHALAQTLRADAAALAGSMSRTMNGTSRSPALEVG
jgi:hypothetical protein